MKQKRKNSRAAASGPLEMLGPIGDILRADQDKLDGLLAQMQEDGDQLDELLAEIKRRDDETLAPLMEQMKAENDKITQLLDEIIKIEAARNI